MRWATKAVVEQSVEQSAVHVSVHDQPLLLVVVCGTVAGVAGVAAVVDAVVADVNLLVVEPDAVALAVAVAVAAAFAVGAAAVAPEAVLSAM